MVMVRLAMNLYSGYRKCSVFIRIAEELCYTIDDAGHATSVTVIWNSVKVEWRLRSAANMAMSFSLKPVINISVQ